MKNPTIIFRTSNSCNLNCTYCYDKKNHFNLKLENDRFTKKIDEIVNNINTILESKDKKSEFIFHGGEPLLIKPVVYDKLIQKIRKQNPNLRFSIQTNGTLISNEFIEIFKKHNIHVGVSLDGYNEEQNKNRVDFKGNNSFEKVLNGIELLQENNVKFGVVMTISKSSIGHEKELYNFISQKKINCNIRPVFSNGLENNDFMMTNEEYYNFFKNLFDIWLEDTERKVSLRQIREIYESFIYVLNKKYKSKSCSKTCNCFNNFISLDIDGNLYSCNRTYNNKEFYYGNINKITIDELKKKMKERNDNHIRIVKESKCINCKLYENCKGGCPANAFLRYNKDSIDDYYCKARIRINDYIYNRLNEEGIICDYQTKMKEINENTNCML